MNLTDEGRKRLKKLMLIQEVSQRDLAVAVGMSVKSHSYIGRLVRGEVRTLDPETAIKMAVFLQVGVDDLFVPRASNMPGHAVARRTTGRAA